MPVARSHRSGAPMSVNTQESGGHMSDVVVERRGPVAWLRLNRPERRNAYDAAMAEELIAGVRQAADAAVIVVTGVERSFCAGGYLANLAQARESEIRAMFDAS